MTAAMWAAVAILGVVPAVPAADRPSAQEARQKAADWLRGLGDRGLVTQFSTAEAGRGWRVRPVVGSNNSQIVLERDGWGVVLGFAGAVTRDTTLEQLRQQFKFVALDRVPTPGLTLAGWDVRPRTPVSSFKEGVEIREYKDGVLTVHVKTRCFALFGSVVRQPGEPVIADRPADPGTFFQLRQDFPLEVTLAAPLAPPGK